MSEPLSNAALDRLLGMVPVPPLPRADLAERIVAEVTRPGRKRARPVVRRDRQRGWRRSSLITGIIALNLLAASAIASVLSGVPVHVALARLAALPAHLFHRHHQIEHAAHHVHVRAKEPVRAVAGGVVASSSAEVGKNRQSVITAPLPTVARPVPTAPLNRPAVPFAAVRTAQRARPHIAAAPVYHASMPPTEYVQARERRPQNTPLAVHSRQHLGARDRAELRADKAGRAARLHRGSLADRTDHMLGSGREMRPERDDKPKHTKPDAEAFGANQRARPSRAEIMDRAALPRPSVVEGPAQSSGNRGFGQPQSGDRPRWANDVVVNPAIDGSPTARSPMRGEPQMAQQRAARAERQFERGQQMAQGRGPGAAFRPGPHPGWHGPPRPPKMRPMPKRLGGFGGRPHGGGRRH